MVIFHSYVKLPEGNITLHHRDAAPRELQADQLNQGERRGLETKVSKTRELWKKTDWRMVIIYVTIIIV
jgi:hypothetical protein